jgi:hypothetical protein
MKSLLALAAVIATFAVSTAHADRIQICVDSQSGLYKAKMSTYSMNDKGAGGVLEDLYAGSAKAIPQGTHLASLRNEGSMDTSNLAGLEGMEFQLKHQLSPVDEMRPQSSVVDSPRVYSAGAVVVLCSSSMDQEDYDILGR